MRSMLTVAIVLLIAGCSPGPESWTPSDSDLVFASRRDGNSDIYLLRAGDSVWTKLTDDPAPENWPVWSPDGKKIAYQKWVDGKLDVWVMDADGGNQTRLTEEPDHDYIPAWTPDGTYITFGSWRTEEGDTGRANHIYIMNTDGSDQRRFLQDSPGTSTSPSWSPDGSMFAMNMSVGNDRTEIFLFDKDGNKLRQVTEGDTTYFGSPEFSPDGSSIVYYADNGATSKLVIADLNGAVTQELLTEGQNWYGRWSPDGNWIVYTAAVPGTDQKDLDIMAVDIRDPSGSVLLAGGPTREAEGSWKPGREE